MTGDGCLGSRQLAEEVDVDNEDSVSTILEIGHLGDFGKTLDSLIDPGSLGTWMFLCQARLPSPPITTAPAVRVARRPRTTIVTTSCTPTPP